MEYIVHKDVPVNQPTDNPRNARDHVNIEDIKRSITLNGFRVPIIVDEGWVILSGHGRRRALRELHNETIPIVIQFMDLTQQQKEDFLVRDNKSTELGSWDMSKLFVQFEPLVLRDLGFDLLRDKPDASLENVRLEFDVNRKQDFVVLYCETEEDFVHVCEKLGLGKVMHPKNRKVGIGRIVSCKKFLEILK